MLKIGLYENDRIVLKLEDGREICIYIEIVRASKSKLGVAVDAPKTVAIRRERHFDERRPNPSK